MSLLSKKYGLDPSQVQALLKDGHLKKNTPRDEQIVMVYNKSIQEGKPRMQAITDASEFSGLEDREIYNILKKFL
jgi:hypothetical protein